MDDTKLLKELLEEQCAIKGLSAEKLAGTTGIPERFVQAFFGADEEALPAAPYIRGYVKKIAQALDLDGEELWLAYQRESKPHSSGVDDRLPENRFALKRVDKKWIAGGLAGALIMAYALFNTSHLLGTPALIVEHPRDDITTSRLPTVVIEGSVENATDRLTVNGEQIVVDRSGKFKQEYPLDPGTNTFTVTAKRFLGKETTVTRQVIYEPPTGAPKPEPPADTAAPPKGQP